MRRFGVEIEFVGDLQTALDELRQVLPVNDQRHTHLGSDATAWSLKRDGSVQRGGELVSPPLDFDDPEHREQINLACQALQRSGAQTHASCGIHIHIEAVQDNGLDMTGRQIAAVVRFTYKFEDAIYRIASSGWQSLRAGAVSYARPIPEATARAIMEVKDREGLDNVWAGRSATAGRRTRRQGAFLRSQDRYTATNLQALHAHNTIEFRYFNSSLNPNRIQAYAALCMAIVQDARNGFSRSVKKSYRIGDMESGAVKDSAVILRLQQILRSDSKDTKICMSAEDWKNLRKTCWNDSKPQPASTFPRY